MRSLGDDNPNWSGMALWKDAMFRMSIKCEPAYASITVPAPDQEKQMRLIMVIMRRQQQSFHAA